MTAGRENTLLDAPSCIDAARRALAAKKVLVVGLASTGVSLARFLKKCGSDVVATDIKPLSELPGAEDLRRLGVRIECGGHREGLFSGAELIVTSPGVPYNISLLEKARKKAIEVISDIELAFRFTDCPVIAVGGTNGKTTTTALLGAVLESSGKKVFVGGNIGTPAIEYVESGGGADACVWEVSSFHLETISSFRPHIAILLNITEDHLDRYKNFNEYAETKMRLFMNQTRGDYAIVNVNDPVISGYLQKGLIKSAVIPFTVSGTLKQGLFLKGGPAGSIVWRREETGAEELYPTGGFKLQGLHNIENIMSVIAASRLSGVSRELLLSTLSSFAGLRHRMEFIREVRGVRFINDSKGTNIGALMMALRGLDGPVILIAGGRDKGGDYAVLKDLLKEKVKLMILIGEARSRMKDALGGSTETVLADSFEEAVRLSSGRAERGDTVLLSPACSSFDMFKSYKERGDRFRTLVEAL